MGRAEPSHLPILEMPFGVFLEVRHLLENIDIVFGVRERVNYGNPIPLYDYQKQAVDEVVRKRYGILQAPAGCGKTQMGLAVIQKHGYKALWLTHTKDLLNQSKERAERYMDKSLMGTITEGHVDIGSGITFATVQTMSKLDLREYRNTWGVIICDECHRVCCSANGVAMFEKVLNALSCGHKYGLSATVHRSDGLIRATFALIGRVIYTVPDEAVKALVEPVSVETVQTEAEFPEEAVKEDGSIVWAKLINGLCADDGRCACITDKIIENRDYSCLILSDRLSHLETLMGMLPDDMRADAVMISGKMTSKKGKAERELAIEQMRTGEKKYLFSSYNLSREGLDIPRLERLFLTTPQKDEAVIIQSLGRIARKFEGKAKPVCIDFVDSNIGMMVGMWKKRMRIYRNKGVEI
jgi:superfamily II DNA or RNA helicase